MASFKASLLNPQSVFDYVLDSECKTVTFQDYSNYTTNTDVGHAKAYFTNYRTVTITHHTGLFTVLSSLLPNTDVLFIYPAATMASTALIYTIANGDGVYTVKLVTVPSYDSITTYPVGSCVYYGGLLYKALLVAFDKPPDIYPAYWQAISESELSAKYTDINYFKIVCDAEDCEAQAVLDAAKLVETQPCADNQLCKNKTLLKAIKINIKLKAAQISFDNGEYECAGKDIDYINSLCLC